MDSLVSAISAGERLAFYTFYLSIHFFVRSAIAILCVAYSYVKMHVGVHVIISSCLGPVCMDDMYGGVGPQL